MAPAVLPEALMVRLVKERFGIEAESITMKDGWCYSRDLDGDSRAEYLFWLEKVVADEKELVMSKGRKLSNLFVYTKTPTGLKRTFEAYHTGPILMPHSSGSGKYSLTVWTEGTDDLDEPVGYIATIFKGKIVGQKKLGQRPGAPELSLVGKLVTANYIISIGHSCPEGCVSCNNITYHGVSRRTGKSITLIGSTWHSMGADGVTPSRFRGYYFKNGDVRYFVHSDGLLDVYRGKSEVLISEKGTWNYPN